MENNGCGSTELAHVPLLEGRVASRARSPGDLHAGNRVGSSPADSLASATFLSLTKLQLFFVLSTNNTFSGFLCLEDDC
jgi:hypothetical protein